MTDIVGRWLAGLAALLLLAMAAPAATQDFPARPAGPVLDAAQILSPAQEAALDQRLRTYNTQTGRAIVVATVPSLQGQTIERYAADLFAEWGIGGKSRDQGLLLLVAPRERQVRIEVGYGLTPYVTDILSGRIIRDIITPRFRQNDYGGGIAAGIDALVTQLNRSPEDAAAVAEAAAAAEAAGARRGGGGPSVGTVLGAVFWGAMILGFMLLFGRGRGRRGRRHRRYGAAGAVGEVLLWHAVGSALGQASRGSGGWGGGGGFGGGGFGGFGGGMSGGGGASGSW